MKPDTELSPRGDTQPSSPYLGSSWTTVLWAKLRKAAQKFMHTEGFQPSRSCWRGHKRQETWGWEEGKETEGTGALDLRSWSREGVGLAAGSLDTPTHPHVFKHLHGREGL